MSKRKDTEALLSSILFQRYILLGLMSRTALGKMLVAKKFKERALCGIGRCCNGRIKNVDNRKLVIEAGRKMKYKGKP